MPADLVAVRRPPVSRLVDAEPRPGRPQAASVL